MGILKGLAEVVLYVENMQEMVEFYRDSMGFKLKHPEDGEDFRNLEKVIFDTDSYELHLYLGGKQAHSETPPSFSFQVVDMDEAREELLERGVPTGEPWKAENSVWYCKGEDPEGNQFLLEHVIPPQPIVNAD